ncbi:helix-turn-helix transcriptional regulator [Actinomadura parmotrematis]|uniref:Helix-turn-helix transcriptional regulator n=1 Tax=Actinomadura parmotrematis TaxID=2864039 RepID=A0ABS7FTG6_9ACTN|nr:helix-turn-helix transcriptional regulator [Actinomadura parmotrematis]MBW8482843.1 helix-turn-helix transcriptional regulator [Actinomadura parmotrematis]
MQTGPGHRAAPAPARRPHRRADLAAFLRSRRERITPEDVGMPPGPRRRTPGLRREEVAQLAGVGVTWYTWLEQGRPINASPQVLDAVARTLRLDAAERGHLYRLADLPDAAVPPQADTLPPEVRQIIDGMLPQPVSVVNDRGDVLVSNTAYDALFPTLRDAPPGERNTLWQIFTLPDCCNPLADLDREGPEHVAVFRHRYSRHKDEPAWRDFVRRLRAESPRFALLWDRQDVALPGPCDKVLRHAAVGEFRIRTTGFELTASPGVRMIVYTPADAESRERVAWLADHPEAAELVRAHAHGRRGVPA